LQGYEVLTPPVGRNISETLRQLPPRKASAVSVFSGFFFESVFIFSLAVLQFFSDTLFYSKYSFSGRSSHSTDFIELPEMHPLPLCCLPKTQKKIDILWIGVLISFFWLWLTFRSPPFESVILN